MAVKVERSGSLVRVTAEAPKGMRWLASDTHELVAESRGGASATKEARADVIERMRMGFETCGDPECDWCHDDYYDE